MARTQSIVAGAAGAILVSTAAPASAQGAAQFSFNLPGESLSRALRDVAVRTGRNLIAPDGLLHARQAPPLAGTFTAEEAVARLLEGTDLRLRLVDGTLVIERVPFAADTPGGRKDAGEDDIVVTGTHVRGAPPASPVVVLTRNDMDRTGATSVEELVRIVPQNSQSGINKENGLLALPDQDPTDHGSGINLRGLGQRATLVLLDGRRLTPSSHGSFVDVSMIPLSAVRRVEILTDGASAIYGSDAVGGVVNFVLRDRFDGFETTAQAGTATEGGGTQFLLSQAAGKSWGSGHGLLAYEFRGEDEIRASERSFTILRPDTFLLPRERKHSILGTLEQDLAPGLRASLTGSLARRSTDRTIFLSISALPVAVDARAKSATASAEIAYDLPDGWLARVDGNYGLSKTTQLQVQPGGIPVVNSRDVRNETLESEVHLDGPILDLPGGAVRAAFGGDLRSERYRDGFSSTSFARTVRSARRTVASLYGELIVPLFSPANRQAGLEQLELSAAARYDRYAHTGSSFDPKIGIFWSPGPGLKLRGSYSSSFRAPLLSEIAGAYSALYLPARFFYQTPANAPPGSIVLFLQGSNPDVKPETSRNWTLGADWTPRFAPGLEASFNYYSIRYSNRIALPTSFVAVIGNPAFDSIVTFNPAAASVAGTVAGAQTVNDFTGPGFTNGGATPGDVDVVLDDRVNNTSSTWTRGFDVSLRHSFRAGASAFVAEASLTHIISFDNRLTSGSPVVQAVNRPYEPLKWRGRWGVSWSRPRWSGSLFMNFAGRYRDARAAASKPVSAYATLDASLSYEVGAESALRGTRVSLFAENLLAAGPPKLAPDPGSATGPGYDPVNASARGRFVAVQLRKTW